MDKRLAKLRIAFPTGWRDISSENPDGPPTFVNEKMREPGVLQISTAEYLSGEYLNPTFADLVELSKNIGRKNDFGDLVKVKSGQCAYGHFGCARFSRNDFPCIVVWHLTDGKNFVFVTFICTTVPDQEAIEEADHIVGGIKRRSFIGRLF